MMGLEPTTPRLPAWYSPIELHPRDCILILIGFMKKSNGSFDIIIIQYQLKTYFKGGKYGTQFTEALGRHNSNCIYK